MDKRHANIEVAIPDEPGGPRENYRAWARQQNAYFQGLLRNYPEETFFQYCERWRHYFTMFRDYRITISVSFSSGARVGFFGTSRATYAPNGTRVEMYAAWLAVVRGKRIAEWRICADNEPARAAMRR